MKVKVSIIYQILLLIPCVQVLGILNIPLGFFSLLTLIILFTLVTLLKRHEEPLQHLFIIKVISILFVLRISSVAFIDDLQISHMNNLIYYILTFIAFCVVLQSELFKSKNDMLPSTLFHFTLFVCIYNIVYFITFALFGIDLLENISALVRDGYLLTEDDYIGLFGYKLARVGSVFGTANLCAAFILTVTPLMIYYNKRTKRMNEFFMIMLLVLGMLPTGSRLGIVLILVYILSHYLLRIATKVSFFNVVSGMLFIGLIVYNFGPLVEFLTERSSGEGVLGNRVVAYTAVFSDIEEFAWSGAGYANVTGYTQVSGVANVIGESLHNVVLTLIVENGIVFASTFFLIGLATAIWLIAISGNVYFLSSILLLIVSNLFTISLFNYAIMYCLLIWVKMLLVDQDYNENRAVRSTTIA